VRTRAKFLNSRFVKDALIAAVAALMRVNPFLDLAD
jgi:hypothetical protein